MAKDGVDCILRVLLPLQRHHAPMAAITWLPSRNSNLDYHDRDT